jgi:plasmid stabilization system protein ParE
MKRLEFHPEAQAEAKAAFDRYWEHSSSVAIQFEIELRDAYGSLRKSPHICPPYLHGTRRFLLDRYPFSVVFRELLHGIQIVAVAHAKRRPGYWAKRV